MKKLIFCILLVAANSAFATPCFVRINNVLFNIDHIVSIHVNDNGNVRIEFSTGRGQTYEAAGSTVAANSIIDKIMTAVRVCK